MLPETRGHQCHIKAKQQDTGKHNLAPYSIIGEEITVAWIFHKPALKLQYECIRRRNIRRSTFILQHPAQFIGFKSKEENDVCFLFQTIINGNTRCT